MKTLKKERKIIGKWNDRLLKSSKRIGKLKRKGILMTKI